MAKALVNLIEEYFELLAGVDTLGDDAGLHTYSGGSTIDPKPVPGGSSLYTPDDDYNFDGNFHRTGLFPQD